MTDLTSTVREILREKQQDISQQPTTHGEARNVNEFLKEAYRINSHIQSLLHYLQSIRHSYLSITSGCSSKRNVKDTRPTTTTTATATSTTTSAGSLLTPIGHTFTDADRDSIDSSTALLLRDLSASIGNLQSAEKLRQETERTLLNKKYGRRAGGGAGGVLWRWAAGDTSTNRQHDRDGDGGVISHKGKSEEQIMAEETARAVRTVRENVLWYLRRNLEQTAEVQRAMVEKRIERVREKEKSVLYKSAAGLPPTPALSQPQLERAQDSVERNRQQREYEKTSTLSTEEAASIESQLSPEQLQLFAEENNLMLRHYEETLSKVQNAEKSLLEISSLQQTLVSHLSTQEEYISQLVGDASSTAENVGKGNKELKRASERRSTAQLVFWCTTGLCLWLVVWDAIF